MNGERVGEVVTQVCNVIIFAFGTKCLIMMLHAIKECQHRFGMMVAGLKYLTMDQEVLITILSIALAVPVTGTPVADTTVGVYKRIKNQ